MFRPERALGICPMKTKKTMNASSGNKTKCFGSLIDKDFPGIDPSFKLYLEHLSKDGGTHVLDLPDGDHGMPASVRYEEDDTSHGDATDKNGPSFLKGSLRRSKGDPNGRRPGVTTGKAANVNVGRSVSPWTTSLEEKKKTSAVDESYELFLSLVKVKDGFMVLEPEPGVTILYEQGEDMHAGYDEPRTVRSRNEPEPLISPPEYMEEDGLAQADKIASEHEKAGYPSEDLDDQDVVCTDALGSKPSDLNARGDTGCTRSYIFEEKLIAISSQPYDHDDYEELCRKATDRKPVSKQRHLRGASKRYVTKTPGLSYLDHYPDLGVQINSADQDERLGLLRKFFFWLENLCHEGAYMPWISKPQACDPILTDEFEPAPRRGQ